tara:strand:- start:116 stop:280 length:165 start_codon:yes stop_codon:yes gene_type:complete
MDFIFTGAWLGVAILFMLIVISVLLADDLEQWFWVVFSVAIIFGSIGWLIFYFL